jgi:energy-coupling factor transporter ATP-binding protein EcfA2
MSQKGHVVHVNSATLIMGPTGSGKSALLGTLAEYVWETYHKIVRLASSDGGGFPANVQALQQKGIMQVFRMRTRDLPDGSLSFETCTRVAQGWWPQRINPATGEVQPGVKLIPPITERYEMRCPNGHLVKAVPFQTLLTPQLCGVCKVMTDKGNAAVSKTSQITKGFENVGGLCIDSLTSECQWWMSDMAQRSGRLELKGEDAALGGKITSGDLKIGGSNRSHYGFAQNQAETVVLNSLSIPGLVVPPVFTALTLETMDEGALSVTGPLFSGKAKTAEAGAWFGDCLETMVLKNDKDERLYRLCLAEFVDSAGSRHLIKTRAAPGTMPAYLEDPPLKPGEEARTAFTNFHLGVFFTLRDQARVATQAMMDAKYPDAPGLPDGIVEVGEAAAEVPAAESPVRGVAAAAGGPAAPPPASRLGAPSAPPAPSPRAAQRPAPLAPPAAASSPAVGGAPAKGNGEAEAVPEGVKLTRGGLEKEPGPAGPAAPLVPGTSTVPGTQVQQGTDTKPPAPPAGAWARPAAPRPPAPAPRVGSKPK